MWASKPSPPRSVPRSPVNLCCTAIRAPAVCMGYVWVPCVALPSGGGSSVGASPLCGSPVWVPCVGPSSRRAAFHVSMWHLLA